MSPQMLFSQILQGALIALAFGLPALLCAVAFGLLRRARPQAPTDVAAYTLVAIATSPVILFSLAPLISILVRSDLNLPKGTVAWIVFVPLYFGCLVGFEVVRRMIGRRPKGTTYRCPECNYNMRGGRIGGRCPECGHET